MEEHFSPEDVEKLKEFLQIISKELMPEINEAIGGREIR